MTTDTDPREIWLEPACEKCMDRLPWGVGRTWAPDNPYDNCPICGKPPTRYVRKDGRCPTTR